jgi:hypothetical protein
MLSMKLTLRCGVVYSAWLTLQYKGLHYSQLILENKLAGQQLVEVGRVPYREPIPEYVAHTVAIGTVAIDLRCVYESKVGE